MGRLIASTLCFLLSTVSFATEKVVVIPMAGENVLLSQQYERFAEQTGSEVDGCFSNIYTTPNRPTQVLALVSATIFLTANESNWYASPEFNKDGTGWNGMFAQLSVTGGSAGTYSESGNAGSMELDPNSTYQFRVHYWASPAHTVSICTLALQFSSKQDDIVTVTPSLKAANPPTVEGVSNSPLPGIDE